MALLPGHDVRVSVRISESGWARSALPGHLTLRAQLCGNEQLGRKELQNRARIGRNFDNPTTGSSAKPWKIERK